MFAIVTDTLSDLPLEWCEEHNVRLVPMHLRTRAGDSRDVVEVHPADTYVALASKPASVRTSQPSPSEFTEVFDELLDSGVTQILCVTASAALSQTYDNAVAAARAANKRGQVAVIDSKTLSAAEGIVVADLVRGRDMGMEFREAVDHAARLVRHVTLLLITAPGAQLFPHPGHRAPIRHLRRAMEGWMGAYGLVTLDEQGRVVTVGRAADQRMLAGRIARLMSLDAQRDGCLRYVEICVGYPRSLSVLEKPLDTNEFISRRTSVANVSGAVACQLGLGSVGIAYAPARYLVDGDLDEEAGYIHEDELEEVGL